MSWSNRRAGRAFPPAPPQNPVVMAISNNDTMHLCHLLATGANPDALHGDTCPIVFATHRGEADKIDMLLAYHANINATDAKGMTALITAAARRKPEIITLLIARGADLNLQDKNGQTALCHAIMQKDQAAIIALALAGADARIPNPRGETAIALLHKPENAYLKELFDDAADTRAHTLAQGMRVRKPLKIKLK